MLGRLKKGLCAAWGRLGVVLVLTFVVIAYTCAAVGSTLTDSPTVDELIHISAGYTHLVLHDYRMNIDKPPLFKVLAAIPLLSMSVNVPVGSDAWNEGALGEKVFARSLFYRSGNDAGRILLLARVPFIVLTLGLGVLIYFYTKSLAGKYAGLIALIIFVFSPIILAHGKLANTDVPAGLGYLVIAITYTRFLRRQSSANATILGVVCGVAVLLKQSVLIAVLPMLGLIIWKSITMSESKNHIFRQFLVAVLVSVLVIWLGYWFVSYNYSPVLAVNNVLSESSVRGLFVPKIVLSMLNNEFLKPWGLFLFGIFHEIKRSQDVSVEYFMGKLGLSGWWYYFPVLLVAKTTVPGLVLGALGILGWIQKVRVAFNAVTSNLSKLLDQYTAIIVMLLFLACYVVLAMESRLNIGVRHLIPILPMVTILLSVGITCFISRFGGRLVKCVVFVFLVGHLVPLALTYPQYLSYYNFLVGGTENGYWVAVNSNYSWYYDFNRLAQWAKERNINKIYVDCEGGANDALSYYLGEGYIPVSALYGQEWKSASTVRVKRVPIDSYLAVCIDELLGGYFDTTSNSIEKYYPELPGNQIGVAGRSIFIYYTGHNMKG